MATRIVGIGSAKISAIDGTTVTLDRGIGGNGLTAITDAGYLLNVTAVDCQAISVTPVATLDRGKVDTIQVASVAGWSVGNWVTFRTDNSTTTYANPTTAVAAAGAGDLIKWTYMNVNESRVYGASATVILVATTHDGCVAETDIVGEKQILCLTGLAGGCVGSYAVNSKLADLEIHDYHTQGWSLFVTNFSGLVTIQNVDIYGHTYATNRCAHFASGVNNGNRRFINCTSQCGAIPLGSPAAMYGFFSTNANAGTTEEYIGCAAYGMSSGFYFANATPTRILKNCFSMFSAGAGFTAAANATGTNCASMDNTAVTGLFGTLGNVTKAQFAILRHHYERTIRSIPGALRNLDVAGSVLRNAGTYVATAPYDTDGYARDGSTPDIGPCEAFTGLGGGGGLPFLGGHAVRRG